MKRIILLLFIFTFISVYSQQDIQKISGDLNMQLKGMPQESEVLVWVFFKDKAKAQLQKTNTAVVSEKSLTRRAKVMSKNALVDETDLPVNTNYIDNLTSAGFKLKQISKWLNGVSGYVKKQQLASIASLSFVNSLDVVYKFPKEKSVDAGIIDKNSSKILQPKGIDALDYGTSYAQNQQMNVPAVHNMGINGSGVVIGVFDAGFSLLGHEVFSSMNIIAKYDFVNNRADVADGNGGMGSGTHGTETLSTIGGYKPGKLIGPAYGAKFVLAKTENTFSETPIEEDNWIRAIEWADSIGIDVASTSLGYIDFDAPYQSYTWQSMDGKTCRITKAADMAFDKGIVIINSAGNEGYDASHNTLGAPSDGFNVMAIGAVNSSGVRSSFSSVGNTVDGRIKPDVMAMGEGVTVASPFLETGYTMSNGTSFSCPLAAGVAALILSARPTATPAQVRDAMRNTASKHTAPDREYGWGIIDALAAISSVSLPVELTSFNGALTDNAVTLSWATSTENNNLGFQVERSLVLEGVDSKTGWLTVGFVKGAGSSTSENKYTFVDKLLAPGKYCYRLKQVDFDGSYSYSSQVNVNFPVPNSLILFQNYPNPFNPSTNIDFSLPAKSSIRLSVFDILGKEVSILYNGELEKGIYTFQFGGKEFASGIYIVNLSDGKNNKRIKTLLLK